MRSERFGFIKMVREWLADSIQKFNLNMVLRAVSYFLITVIFLLYALPLKAIAEKSDQEPLDVIVKTGSHEGFLRTVFLLNERVREPSVRQVDNRVEIHFNTSVYFKYIKKPDAEPVRLESSTKLINGLFIEPKRDGCILRVENLSNIKTLRLSNPSRLVVDLYFIESKADLDRHYRYIMVDPGHGGYDKGIYSDNFSEKNFVLSFSKVFGDQAEKAGRRVVLSRSGDFAISLRDRIKLVNKKMPDVLISFHVSMNNEFVIYIADRGSHSESEVISNRIIRNIKNQLGIDGRIERVNSIIGAYVKVPSILVELPNPDRFAYDKKTNQKIISAILDSLIKNMDS